MIDLDRGLSSGSLSALLFRYEGAREDSEGGAYRPNNNGSYVPVITSLFYKSEFVELEFGRLDSCEQ